MLPHAYNQGGKANQGECNRARPAAGLLRTGESSMAFTEPLRRGKSTAGHREANEE